jgi:phage host-nuclease inhibitor protein Gam
MKSEGASFIDQIVKEAEEKEQKLNREMADMMLLEIRNLRDEIERTFEQAEKERIIIKNWAISKNSRLTNKIEWLEKKLEAFLKEEKVKTLELAFGTIRFRKQPDRVEIMDNELFLNNATSNMLMIVPETAKADLNKIKSFIKRSGRVPEGCELIPGDIKFSYSINNHKEVTVNGTKETGTGNKQTSKLSVVI